MKPLLKSNLLYLDKTRRKLNFSCLRALNIFPACARYGGPKVSRQFQFYSRRFQYTHGNFAILLKAISIFARQRPRHFPLLSPPVSYGGRQWPHTRVKTQNQKWIVKVDLQREKWKSQSTVDLRTSRTRGYLHETGTSSDWYEFVSVSIHFFSWVYRPKNELRSSDFISVADPTRVTFVTVWDRTVLIWTKNKS